MCSQQWLLRQTVLWLLQSLSSGTVVTALRTASVRLAMTALDLSGTAVATMLHSRDRQPSRYTVYATWNLGLIPRSRKRLFSSPGTNTPPPQHAPRTVLRGQCNQLTKTSHLLLLSRLKLCGSIPSIHLCFRSVHRETFTFLLSRAHSDGNVTVATHFRTCESTWVLEVSSIYSVSILSFDQEVLYFKMCM